jgi:hypothetical protein
MVTRVRGADKANIGSIRGQPYASDYFRALANAPILGEALARMGQAMMEVSACEDTLSDADHEFCDVVIAFDSGYHWLMAGHASLAVQAGVRIEAIKAVREGRETDLTDDECQLVEFTRAVRDGTMTADIWDNMIKRLGSERGAIEYSYFILVILFNHLLAKAIGIRDIPEPELDLLLSNLEDEGSKVSYRDYVKIFGDAAFTTQKDKL